MSREFYIDDVLLTGRVDLNPDEDTGVAGFSSAADYGETSSGGVKLDDSTGTLVVKGWHRFHALETDATPERVWTGYIYGRRIHEFDESGSKRQWDADLVDVNAALTFRVFPESQADANRPAETDLARLTWLLGTGQVAGLFEDTGLANTTDNPVNLGAADFRHRYPGDVLREMSGRAGKQFFLYWDETAGAVGLFYDLATATTRQSTLRISNNPADEDSVTLAPIEPVVTRDPSDQYSGLDLQAVGFSIYRQREATATELGLRRDFIIQSDAIGRLATAESFATLYLNAMAAEQDQISLSVIVTAAQVNLIEAGSAVQVKLTHVPEYTSFTWTRVVHRVVEYIAPERYLMQLDLSLKVKLGPPIGDPSEFPSTGCSAPRIVNYYGKPDAGGTPNTLIWGSGTPVVGAAFTPTAGNILLHVHADRDGADIAYVPTSVPGGESWTILEGIAGGGLFTDSIVWAMIVSDGTETGIVVDGTTGGGVWIVYEIADGDPDSVATSEDTDTGTLVESPISTTPGSTALILQADAAAGDSAVSHTPAAGWTEDYEDTPSSDFHPHFSAIHKMVEGTAATETPSTTLGSSRSWKAVTVMISCQGPCPLRGQWTDWRFLAEGDGVTTDFTLPCPYADGGLEVRVDGVPIVLGLTETDPDAGEFSLDFAPKAAVGDSRAEQVWVRWLGA